VKNVVFSGVGKNKGQGPRGGNEDVEEKGRHTVANAMG
jgi:hypothetical protein